jgi:sulfatase maturation enzyme AslB (radical SAM superfamily)
MLEGKQLSGCQQCYSAESVGAKSRREELIEQYGIVSEVETKTLDISFDNVCNLKCRGCCSASSHLWYGDEQAIYGKPVATYIDKKYLENNLTIDLDGLEYINVSGGEPFLSKKFKEFADTLFEKNNLENLHLTITSNATVMPSSNVYKLMLETNRLSLSLSIDGYGDLNQYFRHGADFSKCLEIVEFFKNLKTLRGSKYTYLQIHTTVSIYNVNLLLDIENFFQEHYKEYNCTHRLLYWPEQLCVRNIPEDLKEQLKPIVESYGEKYIDVLNELTMPGADMFGHFINFHNLLDNLRNESLETINPLLFNYIKNYKNPPTESRAFFLKQIRG